jgi:hypothetical protein
LEKAAELGYITSDINEILNGRHGIRHPETHQVNFCDFKNKF